MGSVPPVSRPNGGSCAGGNPKPHTSQTLVSLPWTMPPCFVIPERGQTGPKDCLPLCGNKRLCRLGVTPAISMPGSHMLKAPFCLYAAWLLIEIRHAGYSRLFPHWCKGCFGHVWRGRAGTRRATTFTAILPCLYDTAPCPHLHSSSEALDSCRPRDGRNVRVVSDRRGPSCVGQG